MGHARWILCAVSLLGILGPVEKVAASPPPAPLRSAVGDHDVLTSVVPSGGDSLFLLGGPILGNGDFQGPDGNPDWDGWMPVDFTAPDSTSHWHVDTFHCANLQSFVVNHAWWCGVPEYEWCGNTHDGGGYGNDWDDRLDFSFPVSDPSQPVSVKVSARLNLDLGFGDELQLMVWRGPEFTVERTFTGRVDGLQIAETIDLQPSEYENGDTVHLRWRFLSDSMGSDEDCWPTLGAAQLDSIVVQADQGQGWVWVSQEDLEAGSWTEWHPVSAGGGSGNFGHLATALRALDPCRENSSPQAIFVDDGQVVPGTGGQWGIDWYYGPGGWIVNTVGGLQWGSLLHCAVVSPIIEASPGQPMGRLRLRYDVYRHEPLDGDSPWIFDEWLVRFSTDGGASWSGWLNHGRVNYGGPAYVTEEVDLTDLALAQGYPWTQMQVALGVVQRPSAGTRGDDGTPAPYFDNVAVVVDAPPETGSPLAITADPAHLAQDAFPASGLLDFGQPQNNSVRFDMARSIAPSSLPAPANQDPGDSIVCQVTGYDLSGVVMQYRLEPNPIFDSYRSSGQPSQGTIPADSCRTVAGTVIPHRFCFDLPDSAFFYPGDVIHYFFRAWSVGMGVSVTLPADTTGFSDFSPASAYDPHFVVRALPTLKSLSAGDQPQVLIIDDASGGGLDPAWKTALDNLGERVGQDYDLYGVLAPDAGVGNGIGGRGTAGTLEGYSTILYTSGRQQAFTLANGEEDPGLDLSTLWAWLGSPPGHHLLLMGENLVGDLALRGTVPATFLYQEVGIDFLDWDLQGLCPSASARVVSALPGNPVLVQETRWPLEERCASPYPLVAVEALPGTIRLAEFADVDGTPLGCTPVAATLRSDSLTGNEVVFFPYDLGAISTYSVPKAPLVSAARTRILEDLLAYFGQTSGSTAMRVPDPAHSSVSWGFPGWATIMACPHRYGNPLTLARDEYGCPVDATITVTLRDSLDRPVANYPAEDLTLQSVNHTVVPVQGHQGADADTGPDGVTTFSGPLWAGGWTGPGWGMRVLVAGQPIPGVTIPLQVNSPDIDGDLGFGLGDISILASAFGQTPHVYDYRVDFVYDHVLDIADVAVFTMSYPYAGLPRIPVPPACGADSTVLHVGIYADTLATRSALAPVALFTPVHLFIMAVVDSGSTNLGAVAWRMSSPPPEIYLGSMHWPDEVVVTAGEDTTGVEEGVYYCDPSSTGRYLLGERDYIILAPVTAEIAILPHPEYGEVRFGACNGTMGPVRRTTSFFLSTEPVGFAVIESEPDTLAPPWTVTGPGYQVSAAGDSSLLGMSPGDYIIHWQSVPGWRTPAANPETLRVDVGEVVTFHGVYMPASGTGAESGAAEGGVVLHQNTPNPFNATTVIGYEVPNPGAEVELSIYDVSGRRVKTLVDGWVSGGLQRALWDGADNRGAVISSGVYFCRLRADGVVRVRRLTLVR